MSCEECKNEVTENWRFCGHCGKELDIPRPPPKTLSGKVFNDPIHGHIRLPPACVKIVDTLQFQRLRHIKQLDAVYLVYPGASHNRFEHSIGVCHLAGKFLRAIQDRQPDVNLMSSKDILCVEIAGLCHDLGQGPFSHIFERKFIRDIYKNDPEYRNWKHEQAAVMMFEYMLEDNDGKIKKELREEAGINEKDLTFIKELIGVPKDLDSLPWPYEGREKDKSFLYEVVANQKHGIDVDKWDYLARDSYMLGIKTNFDHNRCIENAKVIEVDGRKQICYRDKVVNDLYAMFNTRVILHMKAYLHKTHHSIGIMIKDAFEAANVHLEFAGMEGIAECIKNAKSFLQLTDEVLQTIQLSDNPNLKQAKKIIEDITTRNIYTLVAEVPAKLEGEFDKEKFKEELGKNVRDEGNETLAPGSIVVDVVSIDYGMKAQNPVRNVRFYKKDSDIAFPIKQDQVSFFLPSTFGELYIRVYCKDRQNIKLITSIRKGFKKWCEDTGHQVPTGC